MKGLKYTLKPVESKPRRRYRRGSKYDPIIDAFLESDKDIVEVEVKGKNPNYVRMQLNKRIEARGLRDKVKTSVINNVLYLERVR